MLVYVAHAHGNDQKNVERAKRITHHLQINDLENTYICPLLLLSHLKHGEIEYGAEMDLHIDVLSQCDRLIVASEVSRGVRKEIEFANLVGMEVFSIDKNGFIRSFKE